MGERCSFCLMCEVDYDYWCSSCPSSWGSYWLCQDGFFSMFFSSPLCHEDYSNELVCDFIVAFLTPDFSGSASFALEFFMALSLLAPSIVGVATSSFPLCWYIRCSLLRCPYCYVPSFCWCVYVWTSFLFRPRRPRLCTHTLAAMASSRWPCPLTPRQATAAPKRPRPTECCSAQDLGSDPGRVQVYLFKQSNIYKQTVCFFLGYYIIVLI